MSPRSCTKRPVWPCMVLCTIFILACGESDPNEFFRINRPQETATDNQIGYETDDTPKNQDTNLDGDCAQIDWGAACKPEQPTYNVTFEGFEVQTEETKTISLETLYCGGYESVVLIFGDSECPACPKWYSSIGTITKDIHAAGGVVVTSCTSGFGLASLPHDIAAIVTSDANPDYSTGASPLKYPCRYDFTPFTMVVDLSDATILALDSASDRVTLTEVIEGVERAKNR